MSRLVYSTETGNVCPECRQAITQCACAAQAEQARLASLDGILRIRRETQGRKGKGVTIINGLPQSGDALKQTAKQLKQKLSTGGAIRDGELEFQGDVRQALKQLLEAQGYTVKISGG